MSDGIGVADLASVVPALAGRRVLVIGDLCLDEYLIGRAARLSREAPVPVLEFLRQIDVPGAAANPACNVVSMGGEVWVAGVIGDDAAGQRLTGLLRGLGARTDAILIDPDRPTTVKTRILAEVSLHFPQQIARLDRQDRRPLPEKVRLALRDRTLDLATQVDAVLVSDYRGGVADPELVGALARFGAGLLTADSQGDLGKFGGFHAVKANQEETEAFLGRRLTEADDFARAGEEIRDRLGLRAVLITRGRAGMTLVEAGRPADQIPAANASEVFDVTGAGDTVIAIYTLAVAAGASAALAARLATYAAGLVVRRLGNAAPTAAELIAALEAAG